MDPHKPITLIALIACFSLSLNAAQVSVGETFASGLAGFEMGRGGVVTNPGSGGVDDDGFMSVAQNGGPLAARVISSGGIFGGDYIAAGASGLQFALRDIGSEDPAIIRVGIGQQAANFWISNDFWDLSTADGWVTGSVTFNESEWTQVIGTGVTLANALLNVDVLQFRAAAAATGRAPDSLIGDFGVDNLMITAIPEPSTFGFIIGIAGLLLVAHRARG